MLSVRGCVLVCATLVTSRMLAQSSASGVLPDSAVRRVICFANRIPSIREALRRSPPPMLLVDETPTEYAFVQIASCPDSAARPAMVREFSYLIPSAAVEAYGSSGRGGAIRVALKSRKQQSPER